MGFEPRPGVLATAISPPDCLDEPERLTEPEPCSLSDLLRREEWLEDDVKLVGVDAGAGILDHHGDEPSLAMRMGPQRRYRFHRLNPDG